MMSYPAIIKDKYGIFHGSMPCVYLKTGNGGTIYGHDGKYYEIAKAVNETTGRFVCVASNPVDEDCDLVEEIAGLQAVYPEVCEIIYIGYSNGAYVGAQQAWKVSIIKHALLINAPLMINFFRTKEGAEKFKGEQMMFIYGDKDPSFQYFELLELIENDLVQSFYVEGADHNFTGMQDKIEELMLFYASL